MLHYILPSSKATRSHTGSGEVSWIQLSPVGQVPAKELLQNQDPLSALCVSSQSSGTNPLPIRPRSDKGVWILSALLRASDNKDIRPSTAPQSMVGRAALSINVYHQSAVFQERELMPEVNQLHQWASCLIL